MEDLRRCRAADCLMGLIDLGQSVRCRRACSAAWNDSDCKLAALEVQKAANRLFNYEIRVSYATI